MERIIIIKFGIEFVPSDVYWKTTFYSIQAEKCGFDHLFITDHYNNRNVFISLSNISIFTDKIKFGPGGTNPYLNHPITIGQSISSLDEISPNRVICGLVAGDKTTLDRCNITRTQSLQTIKESVQIIRNLTSRREVKCDRKVFNVSGIKLGFGPERQIPIFMGAQGPKMLSLAAEIGDGVLINASHPKDFEKAISYIKDGVSKARKKIGDIEIAAATSISIDQDAKQAKKSAIPIVAFIVAGCPDSILKTHNISLELTKKIRKEIRQGRFKEAFSKVNFDMMDVFSIYGTPLTCIEKIDDLLKKGITLFIAGSPIGPNIRSSMELFSKEVMPHFKTD
jgi:5,10-methylenetetrahydromethanopterin reductase